MIRHATQKGTACAQVLLLLITTKAYFLIYLMIVFHKFHLALKWGEITKHNYFLNALIKMPIRIPQVGNNNGEMALCGLHMMNFQTS